MTHWSLALVLMSWAALSAGCSSYDYGWKCRTDRCADIPCGAIPPPAGTYSCRWQTEQIARAQQDFFVIHQTEWYLGGKQLGPDGRKHVREIAKRLGEGSCPVIIAATDDDKLNAARKQAVVESLFQLGVFDADTRVVSGESEAEGLYGQEAVRYGTARLQGGGTTTGAGGGLGAGGGGLGTPGSGFGAGTTFGGGTGLGGGMGVY
jgi:hypothetical protein